MATRTGKVARLPVVVREELNRRLRDGQSGSQVLPWLNGLPEVQAVLVERFNGAPVNAQNLSDWRLGGYKEWLERQDKTARIRELATYAGKVAEAAGGSLATASAQLLSGRILELLEGVDQEMKPEELRHLVDGIAVLRRGDIAAGRLEVSRETLRLEQERFKRQTCELFLQWASDEKARGIAQSGATNAEKIEALGQLMFGADWQDKGGN